jgi:hypothetical protein
MKAAAIVVVLISSLAAAQAEEIIAFSAEVSSIVTSAKFNGKAIPVDGDPKWVMKVSKIAFTTTATIKLAEDDTLAFAIHSPVKKLGLSADDAKELSGEFRLVKRARDGQVSYELEVRLKPKPTQK